MNDVDALRQRFRREVMTATWSFYAWKHINNIAAQDRNVLRGMNNTPAVWNTITHALQTTFFITLGRIFDVDGGALSISSFLNKCQTEIQQFGKSALTQRKQADAKSGEKLDWLDGYIANAYEPRAEDFRALKRAAKKHKAKYEDIYRPIRNLVVAHTNLAAAEATSTLFEKTRIGDIEEILLFLHQVVEVITQLHINGRKTELSEHQMKEEEYVAKNTATLLA